MFKGGCNVDQIEICKDCTIHSEVVNTVKSQLESEESLRSLSLFFKAFGDDTRIKIINALLLSEMCVCDLASLLKGTQSAVSHQLKTLKQLRLVKYRRNGKIVYYSLDDSHIKDVFERALEHVQE
ncbi:MAG: metalloregulator ArsR/SmtB family transcription factor [Clostridium sp.]